jgi:hypothetical protein
MKIKSAKNGYHSTQRTIYGRIPASEFYGFVLGIALGYIVRGVVNLSGIAEINNSDLAFVFCAIGVAIGWWYDQKYYMVKDEPEEGAEEMKEGEEAEPAVSAVGAAAEPDASPARAAAEAPEQTPVEREVIEGTSTQDMLRQMFARNEDNNADDEDVLEEYVSEQDIKE